MALVRGPAPSVWERVSGERGPGPQLLTLMSPLYPQATPHHGVYSREEELLREMEELRSENDYLKVRSLPRRRCPGGSPRSGCGLGPASPGVPAPKALPPSASHFPAPDTPGAGNLSQSCGRSSETCGSSRFSTHLACF